ncbi:MAG: hypothetical protein HN352_08650 [Bacteroidetes bacterium]|nr:hypothetical protein [Bacteroidota bacterium]MBT4399077.1 hypothetical protein [Bacteroidota bacterium]MBT4410465.1 hypothetical protein [Bacteroidota bacterium]MBT5425471.1 hypothetical protein [Bacteroidota bacterium]MBT7094022.1 hypothetical protein [Bacteroidota bacterium]
MGIWFLTRSKDQNSSIRNKWDGSRDLWDGGKGRHEGDAKGYAIRDAKRDTECDAECDAGIFGMEELSYIANIVEKHELLW